MGGGLFRNIGAYFWETPDGDTTGRGPTPENQGSFSGLCWIFPHGNNCPEGFNWNSGAIWWPAVYQHIAPVVEPLGAVGRQPGWILEFRFKIPNARR